MGFKKQFQKLFCGCTGRSKKYTAKEEFERYEPSIKQDLKKDFDLDDFEDEIVTKAVKEGDLGIVIANDIKRVSISAMEEIELFLMEKELELLEKIVEFDANLLSTTVAVPSSVNSNQQASEMTFKMPTFNSFEFVSEMVPPIFSGVFQNKLINFDCINFEIASQPQALLALPCPPAATLAPAILANVGQAPKEMLAICAPPPTLVIEMPFVLPAVGKAPKILTLCAPPTLAIDLPSISPVVGKAPQMLALCAPPAMTIELPSVDPDDVQAFHSAPVVLSCQSVKPIVPPCSSQTLLAIELPSIVKGKELCEPIDVGFFEFDLTSPLSQHCLKLPQDAASAVELINKIFEDEGFEDCKVKDENV